MNETALRAKISDGTSLKYYSSDARIVANDHEIMLSEKKKSPLFVASIQVVGFLLAWELLPISRHVSGLHYGLLCGAIIMMTVGMVAIINGLWVRYHPQFIVTSTRELAVKNLPVSIIAPSDTLVIYHYYRRRFLGFPSDPRTVFAIMTSEDDIRPIGAMFGLYTPSEAVRRLTRQWGITIEQRSSELVQTAWP